ncbi:MAG: T9SS type A sorting domain-containing protein, partial [Bacteroidales bacterium]|nr:T9SS type A sorting domain-containing protein [Bacteroidales bacterium]
NDLTIKNSIIDGGYHGIYLYGTSSNYYQNITIDSNTLTNQYADGIYLYYVSAKSVSYNRITPRPTNVNATWQAIYGYYFRNGGNIIGNRISAINSNIGTALIGIYLHYTDNALVANNEIYLSGNATTTDGIYVSYPRSVSVINNTVYTVKAGTSGTNRAHYNYVGSGYSSVIKNNIFVASGGANTTTYAFYLFGTSGTFASYKADYDIDYNNYHSTGTNMGYVAGVGRTSLIVWKTAISPLDQNSVNLLPDFANLANGLSLTNYLDDFLCPVISDIQTDINGTIRPPVTSMGAYTQPPVGSDLMLLNFSQWKEEVADKQTIEINIDVINMGADPINEALFGWTINGTSQNPVSLSITPPLNSLERRNITLTTYQVANADKFDFVIWADSVNGQKDTVVWNNTISATTVRIPLAEFVPPVIKGTIYILDFDVKVKINTITGAPVKLPVLYIETIVSGSYSPMRDSLPMTLTDNDIWQASVPPQYYGSKVIYALTVSDTIGNTLLLKDSVYIDLLDLGKIDTVTIAGTPTADYHTPISMNYNYGWSRQIYLYNEVCPNLSPTGTYITKIAWHSIAANAIYANQTCYMRAIDNTEQATAYLDTLTNGMMEVWNGTLNIMPGWVEITLDTLFFLPANKNLEIIWHHQNGFATNTTHTWTHSQTPTYMTVYAENNSAFPTATGTRSYSRPNIRITKEGTFKPYKGDDLGLISFLYPSEDLGGECSPDHTQVTVLLANLGENDYDFSKDSIALQLEISAPRETNYSIHIPFNTGTLASGNIDTIEFMSALPIMHAGKYEIKAWLENLIDSVIYDDTIFYSYTSGRITLPMDEDFSNKVLSSNFTVAPVVDSAVWTPYSDSTSPVQPVFGQGMLRYAGTHGSMSSLSIQQLDLDGAINPRLEFWYYHDSTADNRDKSYTDVNIIKDGVSTTVLSIFRKDSSNYHGWKHYTVNLNLDGNAQCILIKFISTNKFGVQSVQYIDRILITSMLDLAVSDISISPEITVCDLDNKEVKVVIRTTTSQAIDFSQYNTSLAIEIPNHPVEYHPLGGIMPGYTSNTISTSPNISIPTGEHIVKAYFTSPVDENPLNDTAIFVLNIRPGLSLTVNSLTSGNNCINIGVSGQQKIFLQNTGNMDLSDIKLELRVTGDNYTETVNETGTINLPADSSISYTFINTYTVPAEASYQVQVKAWLGCNPALIDASDAINECADIRNILIEELVNPHIDSIGIRGAIDSITVSIRNTDDLNPFNNVSIIASIEDEQGSILFSRLGTVPNIDPLKTVLFTFPEKYTIPDDSIYYIRVYFNRMDNYPIDDTLYVPQQTRKENNDDDDDNNIVTGVTNVFTLDQNIPNPANNNTRINYSVPEAGEVVFHVHSISGQLLYSKTIEVSRGTHSIDLNTAAFSAGVYFYSIEYKKQRLVKRMSVE